MEQFVTSDFRLGMIAGGQLGKMLALAASQWDLRTFVLDPEPDCPAATVCTGRERGASTDPEAVYGFGQGVDLLTFEMENVAIEALRRLKAEGKAIQPDPEVLAMIQDKGRQKAFFQEHGIPTPAFELFDDAEAIRAACRTGRWSVPFVQKTRRAGYDGKGVAVIRKEADLATLLSGPAVVETAVAVRKELAVIVARNGAGETAAYPPVELVPDPAANLVRSLISPALVDETLQAEATALALRLAEATGIQGLLAVELFLDQENRLWVNEISPRPHNSGHHTIESAVTSQYEQHLRAILDLPLGDTTLKRPAVMVNLLGEPGHDGPVRYLGLREALRIPGVKVHIYGKRRTRPYRKMGHVTVVAATLEEALRNGEAVRQTIKVISC